MNASAKPKNVKCPLDGRLFATKKALAQHRQAVHAAQVAKPATRAKRNPPGRIATNVSTTSVTFSGTDLIGSAIMDSRMKVGQQLLVWDVNPNTLIATRAHQFGQVFTRWRPKKLHISAVPGAGVFTPGSYAMAWTADPGYDLGPLATRLTRLCSLQPNLLSTFGDPTKLILPLDTTQKWYMTKPGEGVESDHGRVFCILASTLSADNIGINFKLDWAFEFDSPEVPSAAEQLETYPDPQWIPIFTDSVSDWAEGKKLTFKHTQGGAVVPFLEARPGVAYVPGPGVNVPYVKSDGTTGTVGAISLIMDSPLYASAMACFETKAKALEYIKTPTLDKILDYKAAGGWVTPDFPSFYADAASEYDPPPLVVLSHGAQRTALPAGGRPGIRVYYRSAPN